MPSLRAGSAPACLTSLTPHATGTERGQRGRITPSPPRRTLTHLPPQPDYSIPTHPCPTRYVRQEREQISRSLSLSFALEAVAASEGLEIDPQAVQDNLMMYVNERKRYGQPVRDMDDPAFRQAFEAEYMREVVLRACIDHANVEWVA